MTNSLRDASLSPWYTSSRADLIADFYVPCLNRSTLYDRAVGYFSSTLYAVTSVALADFVDRGGQMRLICSPRLSDGDLQAMENGLDARERVDNSLLNTIQMWIKNPHNRAGTELLATLLGAGRLDIKIAYRPGKRGIFHSKIALFESEDGCRIATVGSANETGAAMLSEINHESFVAFTSWGVETDRERVEQLSEYFESLWSNQDSQITVHDLPDVPREELLTHQNEMGVEDAVNRAREAYSHDMPSVEAETILFPHQEAVIANWTEAGYRGVVKHATGSGKTITALEGIRRWIISGKPAIVLVPSDLLSSQWIDEAKAELRDVKPVILAVGGSRSARRWEAALSDFTRAGEFLGPRLVIATLQTASTPRFTNAVVGGDHLMLVVDEVHRVGSAQFRQSLTIQSGARLGLSATPERFNDPDGTAAIFAYFGPVLKPEFGIAEAILAGRLVPYDYFVHQVSLTEEEQAQWDSQTKAIQRAYASLPDDSHGHKIPDARYKMMLIRRARILKQAECKVDLAAELLTREYSDGDRWLVYCDDRHQLELVFDRLNAAGLPAYPYHSAMPGSRRETLRYFEETGGIVVAIKCLDEGVDIPATNRALILASSSNPREFIQRRGRVLRRAPGKHRAIVHDALVMPSGGGDDDDVDRLPITRVELSRAAEFARHAQNRAVYFDLRRIAIEFGVTGLTDSEADFEEGEPDD